MPAVKRIVRLHLINTTYMHINYITVGTFVDPMYQLLSAAKRQQLTSAYKKMMFHKAISFTLEWIDKRRSLIEKLESGWVHPLADKYPGYTSEYLIDKSRRAIAACEECLAKADMSWEVQSSNGDCFFSELMNLMRKHCA